VTLPFTAAFYGRFGLLAVISNLRMKAADTLMTSYQTIRRYGQEDSITHQ
jgi:hypothetical protein